MCEEKPQEESVDRLEDIFSKRLTGIAYVKPHGKRPISTVKELLCKLGAEHLFGARVCCPRPRKAEFLGDLAEGLKWASQSLQEAPLIYGGKIFHVEFVQDNYGVNMEQPLLDKAFGIATVSTSRANGSISLTMEQR
ncbi:hypothetical protein HAX54_024683 [Datura stramonium]|uniref:Uncharacterized protein n=1 Tax=Datura stramonium TaxID=4076 RepID=A0ABS8RH46_DATST|nr:hypothetical protein [Datura stramonium]